MPEDPGIAFLYFSRGRGPPGIAFWLLLQVLLLLVLLPGHLTLQTLHLSMPV